VQIRYCFVSCVKLTVGEILTANGIMVNITTAEFQKLWLNLHNEELRILYCSQIIVRIIESKMRWAGHVARMGSIKR
jgi:hypothetical protein